MTGYAAGAVTGYTGGAWLAGEEEMEVASGEVPGDLRSEIESSASLSSSLWSSVAIEQRELHSARSGIEECLLPPRPTLLRRAAAFAAASASLSTFPILPAAIQLSAAMDVDRHAPGRALFGHSQRVVPGVMATNSATDLTSNKGSQERRIANIGNSNEDRDPPSLPLCKGNRDLPPLM